jgi:hypothetical protein
MPYRRHVAMNSRIDHWSGKLNFISMGGIATTNLLELGFQRKRCLDPTFSAGCGRARVGARGAPTHVDFRAYAYVEAGPGSAAAD